MIGTGGASLGKWARLVRANDSDPALTVDQQGTGRALELEDAGVAVIEAADGYFGMAELGADAAAPPANWGRFYVRDNGAGKTQLVVRFPTGAVQILATEP